MERYERNLPAISAEEQHILKGTHIFLAGCGGLGGCLAELCARLGIGKITVCDGDVFTKSNLNRQLLCLEADLGKNKALAAKARIHAINASCECVAYDTFLTKENAEKLLAGADLVLDALDNIQGRLMLEDACEKLSLPLLHGAVEGSCAQAALILPKERLLHRLYKHPKEGSKTCLAFTPMLCAAVQAAEAVKILLGKECALSGKLLLMDVEGMEFTLLPTDSI